MDYKISLRADRARRFACWSIFLLFVDDEWKRKGVGKALFEAICKCAFVNGADKLFISAIPSVETIAFYFSMGCTDAEEIITDYIDTENDRYLEYRLR
ncbi:MAG: GNAT family N-acetyltransferase [Eubacteriales bacterium]|nr:GNAT family N-acetyltransferase [Eubacteriales bacterium]